MQKKAEPVERKVGDKMRADKVGWNFSWGPKDLLEDDCNGISWEETWKWLRDQCRPADIRLEGRVYLIVGSESYITEVWETKRNHYKALATLVWKEKTDGE